MRRTGEREDSAVQDAEVLLTIYVHKDDRTYGYGVFVRQV